MFFTQLVDNFDERWSMREIVFPDLPLDIELNYEQEQELKSKKDGLFHSYYLSIWFAFGNGFVTVSFTSKLNLAPSPSWKTLTQTNEKWP
ncbi:hypothetical protein J3R82DRAFT_4678 [Butyriboletus roseoflavus]|nr:hypothetical protein J3R82DRAFT_4678 [Butyriboletus roseoflavus]